MAHHKRKRNPGARGHGRCCEGHKGYKKGKVGEAACLKHSDRRRAQRLQDEE